MTFGWHGSLSGRGWLRWTVSPSMTVSQSQSMRRMFRVWFCRFLINELFLAVPPGPFTKMIVDKKMSYMCACAFFVRDQYRHRTNTDVGTEKRHETNEKSIKEKKAWQTGASTATAFGSKRQVGLGTQRTSSAAARKQWGAGRPAQSKARATKQSSKAEQQSKAANQSSKAEQQRGTSRAMGRGTSRAMGCGTSRAMGRPKNCARDVPRPALQLWPQTHPRTLLAP